MFFLNFYRLFFSLLCGALFYYLWFHNWWIWILVTLVTRLLWFTIEIIIGHIQIEISFRQHAAEFRQLYGPYGIRIINKAETDWQTKKSLAEVFTNNITCLNKNVELLNVMNTLFQSGLKPDDDNMLIHDLKLKYGKYRIEKSGI